MSPHTAGISVLIPIYNVKDTLRKCIESLQSQTYQNWIAICVDDGSTDGSENIIDELAAKDKRLIVIHKKNGGVASARNAGLVQVKTPYVTMLDADDWLEPETLRTLVEITQKNACELIMYGFYRVDKNGVKRPRPFTKPSATYTAKPVTLFQLHDMLGVAGKCYKMSVIRQHLISYSEKLQVAEDYLFNVMYWAHIKECVVISDYFYNYYESDTSVMTKYMNGEYSYEKYENSLSVHRIIWESLLGAKGQTHTKEEWVYALLFAQTMMLRFLCKGCNIPTDWKKKLKRLDWEMSQHYAKNCSKWRVSLYRAKIKTCSNFSEWTGAIMHLPARLRGFIKHKILSR